MLPCSPTASRSRSSCRSSTRFSPTARTGRPWASSRSSRMVPGSACRPRVRVHFHALRGAIVLAMMRRDLEGRWDRQMVPQYAPAWAALSEKPEEGAAEFAKEIRRCLQWHAEEWEPIEQELENAGFRWREFIAEQRLR